MHLFKHGVRNSFIFLLTAVMISILIPALCSGCTALEDFLYAPVEVSYNGTFSAVEMAALNVLTREDAPAEHTWDLEAIYADDRAFWGDGTRVEEELFPSLVRSRNSAYITEFRMAPSLELEINEVLYRMTLYADLVSALDRTGREGREMYSYCMDLWWDFDTIVYGEEEADEYDGYVDFEEEYYGIYYGYGRGSDIVLVDNAGTEIVCNQTTVPWLYGSPDRELRQQLARTAAEEFESSREELAELLAERVYSHIDALGESDNSSAFMVGMAWEGISETAYRANIDEVTRRIGSLERYYSLRCEALGIDEFYTYDSYAPLVPGYFREYTYEEAVEIVAAALAPLGEDYVAEFRDGVQDRWVDVYSSEGKEPGGCAKLWPLAEHPYIYLNWDNSLDSVLTLAHEFGHALSSLEDMYSYLVMEVPAYVHEFLVLDYLLEQATSIEERVYIIDYILKDLDSSVFNTAMISEFERSMYDYAESGESLTADMLDELWAVVEDLYAMPSSGFPDIHTSDWEQLLILYEGFYAGCYTLSVPVALRVSDDLLTGVPLRIFHYFNLANPDWFYDPEILFRRNGLDITDSTLMKETLDFFDELVDELEEALIELGRIPPQTS